MRRPSPIRAFARPITRRGLLCALACFAALVGGCDDDGPSVVDAGLPLPERFVIGVIEPPGEMDGKQPELDVAVAQINAAGGIRGQVPLALRRLTPDAEGSAAALAQTLVDDPEVVAVIGPGRSAELLDVARVVVDGGKPFLTASATSGELQRAFAGSPFVWRTKTGDIGQMEFILRTARREGVERIGLITRLGATGESFFNWFGFYATNLGFAADDVFVATISEDVRPMAVLPEALAADLDLLVLAPETRQDAQALAAGLDRARTADGGLPFRVVLADTGLDLPSLIAEMPVLRGFEGWVTTFTEASDLPTIFAEAGAGLPSDGPAGFDAVLLVAYGLEAAAGGTDAALADGIAAAVAGDGEAIPLAGDGIRLTLEALRRGERPDLQGSTGTLAFDPIDGVDLQAPTIGHWVTEGMGQMQRFTIDARIDLAAQGGLDLRRARGMFAPPPGGDISPPAPTTRTLALILAASAGWDNYRHQADALRQYQRLRALGVPDDDIVMVGVDDLADHPDNPLPGVVRNTPGGPDLRAGVTYDYDTLSPAQIEAVLRGEVGPETPIVLPNDPDAALFVYLVGHGGVSGLAVEADTTEAGLFATDDDSVLTPRALTGSLCARRAAGGMPRAAIVIEACHAGVFGDADFDGIEMGCPDGETTLSNVLLMTAANSLENSLAAGYDRELGAWVGDEFSVALSDRLEAGGLGDMLGLYREVYEGVAGSHVSLYNSGLNPDLGTLPAEGVLHRVVDGM